MKTITIQQEVLLVAYTTFSKRQLCERDASKINGHLSPLEQLEEACWNGLLNELIPDVIESPASGKKLYLWQIHHGKSFLQIIFSESPVSIEKQFSIDPNIFMQTTFYN